jgi:hypothetical protein
LGKFNYISVGKGCIWGLLQERSCKTAPAWKECINWCWEVNDFQGNLNSVWSSYSERWVKYYFYRRFILNRLLFSFLFLSSKLSVGVNLPTSLKECLRYAFIFYWYITMSYWYIIRCGRIPYELPKKRRYWNLGFQRGLYKGLSCIDSLLMALG